MGSVGAGALQVLVYGAFVALVGWLSSAPSYTPVDPSLALLRVSFSHAGERVEPCRRYTPEEIAAMAPNMRRPLDCARERVPLRVQVAVDGVVMLDRVLPPSGLAGDGASTVYARLAVAPGRHRVTARLRDTRRAEGFDHEDDLQVELSAGDSRLLEFRAQAGGFRVL